MGFREGTTRACQFTPVIPCPPKVGLREKFKYQVGRGLCIEGLMRDYLRGERVGLGDAAGLLGSLVFSSAQKALGCSQRCFWWCSRKARHLCIAWFMKDLIFHTYFLKCNFIISTFPKSKLFIIAFLAFNFIFLKMCYNLFLLMIVHFKQIFIKKERL